nr:reverse transcriptase domain-containing protein [Tanacetum cinerariifolium]
MLPVTQIDTFYNGLTLRHRDTINAAAGGTFMKRCPKECYDLIENMTAHHNDWDTSAQRSESSSSITSSFDLKNVALRDEMAKINKNLMKPPLAKPKTYMVREPTKVVILTNLKGNNQGRNQFFQRASHGPNPPPAYQALDYQALVHQPLIPQLQVVTTIVFTNYMKANDAILKIMQTNMTSLTNSNLELKNMFGQFMKMNTASSSGSGTLPSNIITNPKEDLKGITTQSGTAYQGPTIPTTSSSLSQVVKHEIEVTKDTVPPTNNGSTKDVQPLVVQIENHVLNFEPVVASVIEPISAPKLNQKPSIPYPRSFLKTERALIDVYAGELTLRVNNEAVRFNLDQTSRYSANYNDMMANRIDVIDMACEDNSDFLLEEVDAFLALEDDPTSQEVDHSYYDTKGDILLLEAFFNDDPSLHPPNQGMYLPQVRKEPKICKAKNNKSSVDEPPEVELKDLPPYLECTFLEGEDKLPIIIAKDLKFHTHKILMEDDFEPAVQNQRRVNPKIHDVIKKEVLKLLDAGLIYPISDSPWEKSHFMVKEGILLGHKISQNRIEVDKAKVGVIAKLPHPTTIKVIHSFLGHAGFYRRITQDFSKIARPMTRLLEKDTPFFFSKECIEAFQTLKKKLIEAPILVAPNWDRPFLLKSDASDFAIGAILGQQKTKHFQPIHYVSKTMTDAQAHYTITEKELLAVVYAFGKFQPYLVLSKSIVYTDHSVLKYMFSKQDAKPRLLRWILLLQEFDIIVRDKKGAENLAADHLSRLEN